MRFTALLCLVLFAPGLGMSTAPAQDKPAQSAQTPRECVAIIGAVKAPSRLELRRKIRLSEAIIIAGGLTPNAGPTIEIRPTGTGCPPESLSGETSSPISPRGRFFQTADVQRDDEIRNPYLEAGDLVVVGQLESVFIIGAIVHPQEMFLEGRLTLTEAMALAGGLRKEARADKVRIYRQPKSSDQRLELLVDLKKITRKRAQDFVLQPNDIIEIPGLNPRGPMFSVANRDLSARPVDRVIY